jgi:hypothetical protein
LIETQQIHGHRARDKLDSLLPGKLNQLWQAERVVLLHDMFDQFRTNSGKIHFGKSKFIRSARHHFAEHILKKAFPDGNRLIFAKRIQPPKGEKDRHFVTILQPLHSR